MMGSGIQSLFKPAPVDLGDDPSCYTDKTQASIEALQESYIKESAIGISKKRPCSCGDSNALAKQIQGLMREIEDLKQMEAKIHDNVNPSTSTPTKTSPP